ncbi:MAG: phage Gp37/Gp68 family protein, partial [Caenispirillum sp.]|nr:phage Gp37/Gp68 family protein [Caenispirillum sp.]
MADRTKIEWTDATWNPIVGCSVVSPGCTNCYAMRLAGTRLKHHPSRAGLTWNTKAGPVWTGDVRLVESAIAQPLRWRRPRHIFVCAHGDLFHPAVPDAWIDRVFAVMALCPQHTFQVLTKRPDRMRPYTFDNIGRVADAIMRLRSDKVPVGPLPHLEPGARWWPLPNVWLGVSVEDQAWADERIPVLLDTPAAVRFISAEPLLGPLDLRNWLIGREEHGIDWSRPVGQKSGACIGWTPPLDWVIVGGESGPGARPMHPDWARSLRDQCAAAGVPFLFKQWGAWTVTYDRDAEDPDWRRCPTA